MSTPVFKGVATALITPFTDKGIDYASFCRLIEEQLTNGIDALVVCGTTGENPTHTEEEHNKLVELTVKKCAGRMKTIVGVGGYNTAHVLEQAKQAEACGADGILMVTPYYNKSTQKGLIEHFTYVADRVSVPMILYNVPGRTGCSIPVSVVEKLSKHPNIAGIKEASGDMSYAMKIAHCIGPDFALYSGNDDITVPLMSIGGSGVISVYANVMPRMCHEIVADYLGGNQARAVENHLKYLKLMNDLFMEVNPIPVKAAMNLMGLNVGPMRLPLCEMTPEHTEALRRTLEEAGLL